MTMKDEFEENLEILRQQRDELQLKMHLAGMEIQEEWDKLEGKWDELVNKSTKIRKELDPTLDDISIAYKLLEDELKEGYQKLEDVL